MKQLLYILTAILLLAACSANEELAQADASAAEQKKEPVSFEPYMARTTRYANTRATNIIDNSRLQSQGFGVFAYDHGTTDIITYNKERIEPNFMFNQLVKWGTTSWTYSPVKYWPNNPGDRVSFFAYAPYIDNIKKVNPKDSPCLILERGNIGPLIFYNSMVDDLDHALDLCWGANATTDVYGHAYDPTHSPVDFIKNGDTEHVAVSSKIKFNFKHALSRLKFNVQIFNDVLTDGEHHGTPAEGGSIDANSTITIKSLKLVGLVARDGYLSLYDGTWDAQYETVPFQLLPYIEPESLEFTGDEASQEVDLFDKAEKKKYLTLIPGTHFKIEIEYWVQTKDTSPGAHPLNSTVTKNIILSDEEFTLEQGKAYEFHLNLGMTTVKFDATVTPWVTDQYEVDLPNNKE